MRCKCFPDDHEHDCDLLEALTQSDARCIALATDRDRLVEKVRELEDYLYGAHHPTDPRAPKPVYVDAAVPECAGCAWARVKGMMRHTCRKNA